MKDKIIKIFNDRGVEKPEALFLWIEPIIKKEYEKGEKVGRSWVYENIVKHLSTSSSLPN